MVFVQKDKDKSKEDVAEEYILELINRSLLIITERKSVGGIKACELHDLILDMCRRTGEVEKFGSSLSKFSQFMHRERPHLRSTPEPSSNACSVSALHCRAISNWISAMGYSVTQMPLLRVIMDPEFPIDEKTVSGPVHLRYLRSYVRITKLPEGISKLVNLEYLLLLNCHILDVPSSILEMVKLTHVHIDSQVIFLKNCDISRIRSNVKSLSCLRIRNREDEEILKCSPHLLKLKCICEGLFPDLTSFSLLKSLNISVFKSPRLKGQLEKISLPSTLKKVTLSGTNLLWEEGSVLGRLPNLQVLKLLYDAFCGKEWKTRDDEFQELRFLKMHNILSLRQWTSWSEHFPKLLHLVLDHVRVKIPLDFGNISTLQTIEVGNCGNETNESANLIREEQLEYENEDLKIITNDTSMRGLVEYEVSPPTLAPQPEHPNMEESPDHKSAQFDEASASTFQKICPGCNTEILPGCGFHFLNGFYWHSECFCCHACKQPIYDNIQTLGDRLYHYSCYKEVHIRRCYVCKDYARTNADGDYDGLKDHFWEQYLCRSHKTDGTPECFSCHRFETILDDGTYLILDDGRALCMDCNESSIKNTEECEALYMDIRDFFQGLNVKVQQDFPVLLVDRQAMHEATKRGNYKSYLVYNKDMRRADLETSNTTDNSTVIDAILVLSCLPRMVTGYCIAFQMMKAWLLLEGHQDLSFKVEVCISEVLGHMWLEHEIVSCSSEKSDRSEFEKKLGQYRKHLIENESRSSFKDGFWEGKKAVDKYGLKHTLDHICHTGSFPN